MSSAAVRRVLFALLFFTIALTTLPQLVKEVRESVHLLPLTKKQRLEKVAGSFYTQSMRLNREIPPDQPIALMLRAPRDIDTAVFFNYYTYPRVTRIYSDLGGYRNDPKKPQIVVAVDHTREPHVRTLAYEELRHEMLGADFVTRVAEPLHGPSKSFDVSLVCSLDGPAPDSYVTEAVIENNADAHATVKLQLYPSGRTAELKLDPRQVIRSNDFVYETFGTMQQGWLRVTSDQPLLAGFWFANPGRDFSAPVPLINAARSARIDAPAGSKFYVVNPGEEPLMVKTDEGEFLVARHDVISGAVKGPMTLTSDTPFYAFASWRDREGRSLFAWQ